MSELQTKFHVDVDGNLTVEQVQDVEPVLEANKKAFNAVGDHNRYTGRDMYRVASIPNIVIAQWMKEGVDLFNPDHAQAVKRKLNSPEYAYLRTRPGRI